MQVFSRFHPSKPSTCLLHLVADKKRKQYNYYSSWPQTPQEREYIMNMSRARMLPQYKSSSLGGRWTHQWIESQNDPNADESGIFALHNVHCLIRNKEPGEEYVPPEFLRWKFAAYVAVRFVGAKRVVGCHVKRYFGKNEEVIKWGFGDEPAYADMRMRGGQGDEGRPEKRRLGPDGDEGPKKKRRREKTFSTIVVETPEGYPFPVS